MTRLLLLLLGGAAGYLLYQQHRQEAQLLAQLQQLVPALDSVNASARWEAHLALERMEASIAKNRNPPQDTILLAATRLQARINQLLDTLQARRVALLRATGHPARAATLPHPDEADAGAQVLEHASRPQQQFEEQLVSYAAALRQLPVPDSLRLRPLRLDHLPVAAALADLAHLENRLLTTETHVIRQLHQRVGATPIHSRLVAVATAESDVIAPGETYRARLLLVKSLLPQTVQMYCNGQPVPIGPTGAGLVRFRAPTRLGPATWVGTIRMRQNGRDTTFAVRIPYRVVRR